MNRKLLLFVSLFFVQLLSAEEEKEPSLELLGSLVETWTELRKEVAAEKREWREQKSFLESEIRLLENEILQLNTEIEEFQQFSSALEVQQQKQVSKKQELMEFMQSLEPVLDNMETFVRRRISEVPPALQDQVVVEEKSRTVDRVQSVASSLRALEELLGNVHVVREMLVDDQGNRREMEVMYFGLAQGFAVSATDEWAAWGNAHSGEWKWESQPDLAPDIRKALEIYAQQRPATFVLLPFQLPDDQESQP